jgi:uncharacterized protein
MIYLDTSVLVTALTTEAATKRVQSWLKERENYQLCISPWVMTEMYSALAMKLRLGIIVQDERERILDEFGYLQRTQFKQLEINHAHFKTAGRYAAQYQLALRAADALHLAIAADNGASLCTLDQRLFDAANALGIKSLMP